MTLRYLSVDHTLVPDAKGKPQADGPRSHGAARMRIFDLDTFVLEREHRLRVGAVFLPRPAPAMVPAAAGEIGSPSPKPVRRWKARARWDDLAKGVPRRFNAKARRAIVRVLWTRDLRFHDLTGHRHFKHLVDARCEAVRAASAAQPGLSSTALGRLFNRHHTTILLLQGRLRGKQVRGAKGPSC